MRRRRAQFVRSVKRLLNRAPAGRVIERDRQSEPRPLAQRKDVPHQPLAVARLTEDGGAVVVLQMLFTYAPPLQALFGTQPVPLRIWPGLIFGGFLFFLMVEAEKLILRMVRPR